MTRTYETIFIVRPDLAGDAFTAVVDKFKGVLTEQGATIVKADEWGVRKLAYTVKKQNRGNYVLFVYEAGPKVIAEFERRLRIDESIIKFQTVHLEKGFVAAAPVVEAVSAPTVEETAAESDEESA